MEVPFTRDRETKNTVWFAEDAAGQPAGHPGMPGVGTRYVQTAPHAALGPRGVTVAIEPRGPPQGHAPTRGGWPGWRPRW